MQGLETTQFKTFSQVNKTNEEGIENVIRKLNPLNDLLSFRRRIVALIAAPTLPCCRPILLVVVLLIHTSTTRCKDHLDVCNYWRIFRLGSTKCKHVIVLTSLCTSLY